MGIIGTEEMEDDKKSCSGEKHRNDRCLLIAALCLSTVSILLTIACGVSVISIREKNLEYEAKLKRLEEQSGSGQRNAVRPSGDMLEAIVQDLKMTEKGQKIASA